jgi:hypothetical protein
VDGCGCRCGSGVYGVDGGAEDGYISKYFHLQNQIMVALQEADVDTTKRDVRVFFVLRERLQSSV